MTFHVYDGHFTLYETLDEARVAAQAAIDDCRRNSTVYEWSGEVSEIAVYEAPDDCGEPWRDGTLVLEARERVVEDEDHPLGQYSEFDLVGGGSAFLSLRSWAAENISVGTRGFGFTLIELGCEEADLSGLPESADIFLRLPATNAFISYGRGRLTTSDASIAIAMSEPLPNEHRPLIRDGILDVMIRGYGSNPVIVLQNALFKSSPTQGTVSIERSAQPDSFELVVADLLPDDDDGGEEPGAMCKRALAKASTSVDLIRQVAIKMTGSDDRADFERSYDFEQKKALLSTAREVIELVRGSSVEGPLPGLGAPKVLGGDPDYVSPFGPKDRSHEFMTWLWRAYRQPADGNLDARMFTRWDMDIAYHAGVEAKGSTISEHSEPSR